MKTTDYRTDKQTSIASFLVGTKKPQEPAPTSSPSEDVTSTRSLKLEPVNKSEQAKRKLNVTPSSSGTTKQPGPLDKFVMKKTFTKGDNLRTSGAGSVSDRIKKIQDEADLKCVMGSGRCSTHNVKLNVKQKKFSVVEPKGDIEWRLRDVTNLECPGRKKAAGRPRLTLHLSQGSPIKKQKFITGEVVPTYNQSEARD